MAPFFRKGQATARKFPTHEVRSEEMVAKASHPRRPEEPALHDPRERLDRSGRRASTSSAALTWLDCAAGYSGLRNGLPAGSLIAIRCRRSGMAAAGLGLYSSGRLPDTTSDFVG